MAQNEDCKGAQQIRLCRLSCAHWTSLDSITSPNPSVKSRSKVTLRITLVCIFQTSSKCTPSGTTTACFYARFSVSELPEMPHISNSHSLLEQPVKHQLKRSVRIGKYTDISSVTHNAHCQTTLVAEYCGFSSHTSNDGHHWSVFLSQFPMFSFSYTGLKINIYIYKKKIVMLMTALEATFAE